MNSIFFARKNFLVWASGRFGHGHGQREGGGVTNRKEWGP